MQGDRRILMVDNDLVTLEAVADMLAAKNYQVTKARDGLEGLEKFREGQFDVAILDLVLPKIDGNDLCRLIRQDKRGRLLPIVAFTALSSQDVAKLPGLTADAYVAKGPLTIVIPNILDAVKAVLKGRRARPRQTIFGYEAFRPRQIVSELLALKQHYQHLVHAAAEVVIELDARGNTVSANFSALRLLGRPETEVTGLPFADLLTPPDRAAFQSLLQRLSQDPQRAAAVTEVTLAGKRLRLRCCPVGDIEGVGGFLLTAGF